MIYNIHVCEKTKFFQHNISFSDRPENFNQYGTKILVYFFQLFPMRLSHLLHVIQLSAIVSQAMTAVTVIDYIRDLKLLNGNATTATNTMKLKSLKKRYE